ncbi:hypothetical protein DMUE_0891 [Dictyocoela muelleri]|nr:hypothetical protein DMUE_0891 [Dictyocoela muelleri]
MRINSSYDNESIMNIAILGIDIFICLIYHDFKTKLAMSSDYEDKFKRLNASGMTLPHEIHRVINSDFKHVCIENVMKIIANEKKKMKNNRNGFTQAELTV